MKSRIHQKIVVERSAVDHEAFADLYQFGDAPGPARSLLVYFGGAISSNVYHSRRETEPSSLVELFELALSSRAVDSVDLLVVPCPLIGRTYPDFRSRIFTFVIEELLSRTPNPEPEHMLLFGNSAGAHIAAVLAFEHERVRALATMAAVGLVEAADESE